MNQRERKSWILQTLEAGDFECIHGAWRAVGAAYQSLEGMPFGLKTRPNHIVDDYDRGRISAEQSIRMLVDAVHEIPDDAAG